jgi:GTPase SAR1 family protein
VRLLVRSREKGRLFAQTIGAYFAMKQCRVNDRIYNLAIWDTAGEEKFDSLTNFYCRNARAVCARACALSARRSFLLLARCLRLTPPCA